MTGRYIEHPQQKPGAKVIDTSTMYGEWYQKDNIAPRMLIAYGLIAKAIVRVLSEAGRPVRTAIDLGSGPGALVIGLKRQGVFAFGVEGADSAARISAVDIRTHDLRDGRKAWPEVADLVTCFDVAEHIEQSHDDAVVSLAVGSCVPEGTILFGAAPPGQDGHGHINCQPPEYWAAKFARLGWNVDQALTDAIRDAIEKEPPVKHEPIDGWSETAHNFAWWVRKNLVAYTKGTRC